MPVGSELVRQRQRSGGNGRILTVLLPVAVVAAVPGSFAAAATGNRGLVAGISMVMLLVLLASGVHIGAAMALGGGLGLLALDGLSGLSAAFAEIPHRTAASWSLSVLPMFILMGTVLWRSGVAEKLYAALHTTLRWMPGSLASVTNVAGGVLSAVTGSTIAVAYALTKISVPEMIRVGYDRRLAAGSALMAGTAGQLIPPSVLSIVYAGVAGTAVGDQLLAGFVPGILLVVGFGVVIIGIATIRPDMAPREHGPPPAQLPIRERLKLTAFPILIVTVIGGLYLGVFTATEAGAVGAFGALVVAALYLGLGRSFGTRMRAALRDALVATGTIFFLLIGANLLRRVVTLSGIANDLTEFVGQGMHRLALLAVLTLLFLVLGMLMDGVSMVLIAVPIVLPAVGAAGIDPVWFGVFVVLMGELSAITPPVGILSYVVHSIVRNDSYIQATDPISLKDVFVSATWMLPVAIMVLLVLVFFPEILLY